MKDTMDEILVVGLNHETAPVPIRERVAFSPLQCGRALQALSNYVPKGVIISTCNRTEVYTAGNGQSSSDKLFDFLSMHSAIPIEEFLPYLYSYKGEEAVRHLFRVASGLESRIVGEYEVLGQVRQAMEEAKANGLSSYPLTELFQHAVGVGRRVRQQTNISKNAASVSSAAVMLAKQRFANLERCQALLIGAGEAGALVAKALVKISTCQVTVTNRSYDKAAALASEIGGNAIPLHCLGDALCFTDILISCSGAPHYIIEPEVVRRAAEARSSQPILLIDIAVPRDIDPSIREMDGVILYDIDDLNSIVKDNCQLRKKETDNAATIVEAEVRRFMDWRDSRDKEPVVKALVDKAEQIRIAHLARTLKEIPGLSEKDHERLDIMTRAIVKKLLHSPLSHLKSPDKNHIQTVRELFDLEA